jgi:membrane-associated phospholipid phosphatase
VVLAFLIYAPILASALPISSPVQSRLWTWNGILLVAYGLLIYRDARKPSLTGSVARDWAPLAVMLLAYQEMGWFAGPHTGALESRWIVWDRAFLAGGVKASIEALGPVVPAVLEAAYTLVYTLAPFSIAVLYLYRKRDRVDPFLLPFVSAVLICYAQFPFWPSEPPRAVFFGQDLPAYETVFRRFNLWMLSGAGIHTSVFPSAHVAGAFAAAFGMRQALPAGKGRWAAHFLLAMAALIALATVYGRYHYVADAAAGFLLAGAGALAAARLKREETVPSARRKGAASEQGRRSRGTAVA